MNAVRRLAVAATVLALGTIAETRANAQAHFGASGGISFPLGDFGNSVSSGYILNGLVEGTPGGFPVGLRGEVNYSAYSFKGRVVQTPGGFGSTTLAGTSKLAGVLGNVVINLDQPNSGPYLIGGVGMYHSSASGTGASGSSNNFGLNGGGGYRIALGGLSTFIEGRVHFIPTSGSSTTFIPVVVGVVF